MNTPKNHSRVGRALPAKDVSDSAEHKRRTVPALRAAGEFQPSPFSEGGQ